MSNGHANSNSSDYPCYCFPFAPCVNVINDNSTPPSLATGELTVGSEVIRYGDITDIVLKCNATAVAQVDHFTPSGFEVGTCCGEQATYEIKLYNPTCLNENDIAPSNYSITFDEDTTGAEIVDAFVALINGDENAFVTATDGNGSLILTADTAGCPFDVLFVSDNIAHLAFIANTSPWASAALVEYDGGTPLTSSTNYNSVDIHFRAFKQDTDQCEDCFRVCGTFCRFYIIDAAAGDAWMTALADITDGTDTASKYLSHSGALSC